MIFVKLAGSKPPKIELWSGLGVFWALLGATWGLLGRSWRCFGHLGEVLWASWVELGASWKGFGASWRRFGAILGRLWSLKDVPDIVLKGSGDVFARFFGGFLKSQSKIENQ